MINNAQFIYRPLLSQMTIKRGLGRPGPGQKFAPLVAGTSLTGSYFVRDRQRIGHVDTRRAPGEFVKRMEASKGSLDTFLMVDHSIIKSVPIELIDGMADQDIFQEEQNASMEALNEVVFGHEKSVHDLVWAEDLSGFEAKYTANRVLSVAGGNKWDTADGKIRANVKTIQDKVYRDCGYMPEDGFITKMLFDTIVSDVNNELGERIKYTDDRSQTAERLASYLGLKRLCVIENLEDTANPGQDAAFDFMYTGDTIMLAYIDPSNSKNKDTLASTFYQSKARKPFLGVLSRYNEDNESYEYKCSAYYDTKMVDTFCAGVITNCLT